MQLSDEPGDLDVGGDGSAGLAGDRAELAHEAQVVADGPVLDGIAVLEADDVDLAEGEGLVGGGQAHEFAGVAAGEGAVNDDRVASPMTWWIS